MRSSLAWLSMLSIWPPSTVADGGAKASHAIGPELPETAGAVVRKRMRQLLCVSTVNTVSITLSVSFPYLPIDSIILDPDFSLSWRTFSAAMWLKSVRPIWHLTPHYWSLILCVYCARAQFATVFFNNNVTPILQLRIFITLAACIRSESTNELWHRMI